MLNKSILCTHAHSTCVSATYLIRRVRLGTGEGFSQQLLFQPPCAFDVQYVYVCCCVDQERTEAHEAIEAMRRRREAEKAEERDRTVMSYETGFQCIQEATGITDIDQLVTKFIEGKPMLLYRCVYSVFEVSCICGCHVLWCACLW